MYALMANTGHPPGGHPAGGMHPPAVALPAALGRGASGGGGAAGGKLLAGLKAGIFWAVRRGGSLILLKSRYTHIYSAACLYNPACLLDSRATAPSLTSPPPSAPGPHSGLTWRQRLWRRPAVPPCRCWRLGG